MAAFTSVVNHPSNGFVNATVTRLERFTIKVSNADGIQWFLRLAESSADLPRSRCFGAISCSMRLDVMFCA